MKLPREKIMFESGSQAQEVASTAIQSDRMDLFRSSDGALAAPPYELAGLYALAEYEPPDAASAHASKRATVESLRVEIELGQLLLPPASR